MTSWTKELDEATILATRVGYWHILLFYLLCGLAAIPTSFLVFSQVFTNATPDHWCAPPPELTRLDIDDGKLRNLTVPYGADGFEKCQAFGVEPRALYAALHDYVDERSEFTREGGVLRMVKIQQLMPVTGELERSEQTSRVYDAILSVRSKDPSPCTNGWHFTNELYNRTLVTEFSLVCDKEWWPRMSNTLFWVGSIFGNLFFGLISDRYGRRPTILLMIFLEVPLSIAASFPSNYWSYTALRVAGGLFFPALYQLPFILALELMPPARRTYTGIVVGMFFASGMCLLALLAFLLRDWFYLSLATSVPFLALFGYYWLIPESPRWLVSRGRIADAEKVLRSLAKKNGIELHRGFLMELHKKIKDQEDGEAETTMLTNVNGHVAGISDFPSKEDFADRRISNMLTFKPDLTKIAETEEGKDGIERIIAREVAEVVNKRSHLRKENNISTEGLLSGEKAQEESHLHTHSNSLQKSTQTEQDKSPVTFRRKSLQLVTRMFSKEGGSDDVENKKMDDENSEGDCKASPLDVFRYPNIRKKFIILTFNWVVLGVVYNSLSYNTSNLGVDDYLAFFIGGVVEIPSYFIAWRCMDRFGRRWVLCVFMGIGGLACISCVLVPEAYLWVTVSLAMLGRLCAAASFTVFYVQVGELLPTVLRAQAMAAASFVAGLGLLACPYIVHLAVYSKALPLTIMGVLSVVGGITSLFLPETLNQPLPQTLGDGEMFGRNFKIFSCVGTQEEKEDDEF